MLKKDLKDGMILELRDGKKYLLTNGVIRDLDGYTTLDSYNENLKSKHYSEFDVMKVYKDSMCFSLKSIFKPEYLKLIWERKELTKREVEVLKALKTLGYNYIAIDINGLLYGYTGKPVKGKYTWTESVRVIESDKEVFNFIKWEDQEPTKIDDLLKGVNK